MPILDHFGLIAPYYDRVIRLKTAEKIIKVAKLPIEGAMLDAGGGTGRVAESLRGQAGSLVLADLSLQMLKQAQKKGDLQTACSHTENAVHRRRKDRVLRRESRPGGDRFLNDHTRVRAYSCVA